MEPKSPEDHISPYLAHPFGNSPTVEPERSIIAERSIISHHDLHLHDHRGVTDITRDYDWDYVMVFPSAQKKRKKLKDALKVANALATEGEGEGESKGKPKRKDSDDSVCSDGSGSGAEKFYSFNNFADAMLGVEASDRERTDGEVSVDSRKLILRSDRCFVDEDGNVAVHALEATEILSKTTDGKYPRHWLDARRAILEKEYVEVAGGLQDIPAETYRLLIMRTIVRRLQATCGLTCRVFESIDNDEYIVTVMADERDLALEADRQDYRLQLRNQPFESRYSVENHRLRHIIGSDFDSAREHLRRSRGPRDRSKEPEIDFMLNREGLDQQKLLSKLLQRLGHSEELDGPEGALLFPETDKKATCLNNLNPRKRQLSPGELTYVAPYASYKLDKKLQPFFRRYPVRWGDQDPQNCGQTLFRSIDRVVLTDSIIRRNLSVGSLMRNNLLKSYFPLHDKLAIKDFRENWIKSFRGLLFAPVSKIKDYFGQRIALYFALREFYVKALIPAVLFGTLVFVLNRVLDKQKDGVDFGALYVAYGVFIVIWSFFFGTSWRRKQQVVNLLWGSTTSRIERDFGRPRPNFVGIRTRNPVTDEFTLWYRSRSVHTLKKFIAGCFLALFSAAVIAVLYLIFNYQQRVKERDPKTVADGNFVDKNLQTAIGILVSVQIALFRFVYTKVAIALNHWQNHRTQTEHENSLAAKMFLFNFVNNYTSFFYIAFYKPTQSGQCTEDSCFEELAVQLVSVFVSGQLIKSIVKIVIPFITAWIASFTEGQHFRALRQEWKKKSTKRNRHHHHHDDSDMQRPVVAKFDEAERQAKKPPYDELRLVLDYNDLVINYGYVTMFVVSFPITPLLAMIGTLLDKHVDGFKLTSTFRRPFPSDARDIGPYMFFIEIIGFISLLTNLGLVLFTNTTFFPKLSNESKWFFFFLGQNVAVVVWALIRKFYRPESRVVAWLEARHAIIADVVMKGLKEEDNSKLPSEFAEKLDLTIHRNPALEVFDLTQPERQSEV